MSSTTVDTPTINVTQCPEESVLKYTIEDNGAGLRAVFRCTQPIMPALDPMGVCVPHQEEFRLDEDSLVKRIENLEMQGEDASLSHRALQDLRHQ